MVEEVEAEAPQQDGFARGDGGEVQVGRVRGLDVAQAVLPRVLGEARLGGARGGGQMSLGEDDGGQAGQFAPVVEYEGLAAVVRVVEAHGARAMDLDAYGVGCAAHGFGEHPLQVPAVEGAGRVVVGAEGEALVLGPLVQAGPPEYRARTVHTVVGEQRDL